MNVAAFDVQYNEERSLWYADLFFDPQMSTSYYPFVRLALARYQPYSVQDVELSPVVLADFIQLAPDRHLTIQFHGEQLFSFTVSGYGPGERTSNYVTATVQTRDPGIPGELGWVDALNSGPIFGTPTNVANYWSFKGRLMLPRGAVPNPCASWCKNLKPMWSTANTTTPRILPPKGSRVVYADTVEI